MVAAIAGIIQCIDRCEMIECTETIIIDYCRFLIDVNLERYFQSKSFDLDKNDSSKLDSRRAIHKQKFVEKVKEYIVKYKLEHTIDKFCNEEASRDQLEVIDKEIFYILNKAQRKVEGLTRGVPFSQWKMKVYSKLKYWASKLNGLKERESNSEVLERRRLEADEEDIKVTIDIAQ